MAIAALAACPVERRLVSQNCPAAERATGTAFYEYGNLHLKVLREMLCQTCTESTLIQSRARQLQAYRRKVNVLSAPNPYARCTPKILSPGGGSSLTIKKSVRLLRFGTTMVRSSSFQTTSRI